MTNGIPRGAEKPMWQQEKKYSLLAFLNLIGTLNVFMADDESNSVELVGLVYVDDSDSDSDEEWKPRRNRVRQAKALRRSSRNSGKKADYVNEHVDEEFSECKGYTHFGHTRKGGDVRPNVGPVQPPKKTRSAVTMLNYFSPPSKQPRPRPRKFVDLTRKQSTAGTSPKTRTRWGRPPKCEEKKEKIVSLKKRAQRTATTGALAVAPTARRKWNGTVRFN